MFEDESLTSHWVSEHSLLRTMLKWMFSMFVWRVNRHVLTPAQRVSFGSIELKSELITVKTVAYQVLCKTNAFGSSAKCSTMTTSHDGGFYQSLTQLEMWLLSQICETEGRKPKANVPHSWWKLESKVIILCGLATINQYSADSKNVETLWKTWSQSFTNELFLLRMILKKCFWEHVLISLIQSRLTKRWTSARPCLLSYPISYSHP